MKSNNKQKNNAKKGQTNINNNDAQDLYIKRQSHIFNFK